MHIWCAATSSRVILIGTANNVSCIFMSTAPSTMDGNDGKMFLRSSLNHYKICRLRKLTCDLKRTAMHFLVRDDIAKRLRYEFLPKQFRFDDFIAVVTCGFNEVFLVLSQTQGD